MFSIIVPTFNAAGTLGECLDSVVRQTCDDFELILVDGDSTDGTVAVATRYAADLGSRLVIHSGPDQGAYDAMNRGIGMATGQWLLFLGADDILYETETLGRVAVFIGDHGHSDLVHGDVIMRSTGSRHGGAFDLDRLLFETNICHQAIFYRRELFASIGPYNLRYRLWADWDFNIRCFSNPALVTRYMNIVVAKYNDVSGLSVSEDREFKKRLPNSTRFVLRIPLTPSRMLDLRWGRPYARVPWRSD
ncbi:glycosyltransferase family 2 protein [Mycobacterium paraintracellulare]|nr:glycosyltransferase family 2 protein [Mycobacterium paraintracellulare]